MRSRSNLSSTLAGASIFIIVAALASCAPFATYPPVEGSVSIDNPAFEPVPSIMADALWAVHERYGGERTTFAFNLPPGCSEAVYDRVIEVLGNAAHPMTDPNEWGYHITQVRSRGLQAEADIVFPREVGPHGLITLRMEKGFDNYEVASAKVWNFPADVPPLHFGESGDETEVAAEDGAGN